MIVEGENIVSFMEMRLDYGDKFLLTYKADILILKFSENKWQTNY